MIGKGNAATLNVTGDLNLSSGSYYAISIDGTQPSQARVSGAVNLGNATLSLGASNMPPVGAKLTIINNGGGASVGGTFNHMSEGATIKVRENAPSKFLTSVATATMWCSRRCPD